MLKGFFSNIPFFSKFMLLLFLQFGFLLFSSLLGILVLVPFYGKAIFELLSTPDYGNASIVAALKFIQILNTLLGILLPALIFNWLCATSRRKYLDFNKKAEAIPLIMAGLFIIFAQPFIGWTNELNGRMVLPEILAPVENWMRNAENQAKLVTDAFLGTVSVSGFLLNVFMIALLPAFAEEILFRGVLANLFRDWSRNVHLAVFLSSFIFAAIHFQFYGFLPRFLLGMAMGYLFFWSGNLWLPMAAHFVNNFMSVSLEFLFNKGLIGTDSKNFGMDSGFWVFIPCSLAAAGILYFIYKRRSNTYVDINTA